MNIFLTQKWKKTIVLCILGKGFQEIYSGYNNGMNFINRKKYVKMLKLIKIKGKIIGPKGLKRQKY